MELTRCTKCVTPETHETITFDTQGICNICNQIEYKDTKIDWDLRKDDPYSIYDKFDFVENYQVLSWEPDTFENISKEFYKFLAAHP